MKSQQEILDKLDAIISKEPNKWLDEADNRFANKEWLQNSQAVALLILRSIRAKGMSQKDLAEILNVSPQQVNKWVKGSENFTFETISKIENALGIKLINVYGLADVKENTDKSSYRRNADFYYSPNDIQTNNYKGKIKQPIFIEMSFDIDKREYYKEKKA